MSEVDEAEIATWNCQWDWLDLDLGKAGGSFDARLAAGRLPDLVK